MQVSVSRMVPTWVLVVAAQPQGGHSTHKTVQLGAQASPSLQADSPRTSDLTLDCLVCAVTAGTGQACAQGEAGSRPWFSTARRRCWRAWRWTSICWAS